MGIDKLYLFSKDTDATATEQGYHYQKLKTLKTWLENRINRVDDVIYCDYEDDIFERNITDGTSKFRQVKLYSKNFSFSQDEIQKSLANFFMLFVKGDYLFDDVSFSFETNSGIAREVSGNDGLLLKEWYENQGNISSDLLERCKTRVKGIIDEFIAQGYQKQMSTEAKANLQQAKIIYDGLDDEVWDKFIKSISWQFDGTDHDKAIPLIMGEIEDLITQVPLPINESRISSYIAVLHHEIVNRTIQDKPEDRMLTNELLDIILLNESSEENKWYAEVYDKWLSVTEIKHFNMGAFYEVIDATRHCRWELLESNHAELWLSLLERYIDLPDTIVACRRKAIYEFLYLLIAPNVRTGEISGTLEGYEDYVRYYFNEFEHRISLDNVEDDLNLLQVVQSFRLLHTGFLFDEEIEKWKSLIKEFIDSKIASTTDIDQLCSLYELKGFYTFSEGFHINPEEKFRESLEVFRSIIPLLKDTKRYTATKLSNRLNQILNLAIRFDKANDETIGLFENFQKDIEDYATESGKRHNNAHNLVKRAMEFVKKNTPKDSLRALDCFHKANKLWYMNETKEGFILSLINTSQFYAGLGMNYAAKYYGLCGVWASINFADYSHYKRISDSYGMIFHADFNQGAWMSALDDFDAYLATRLKFKNEPLDLEKDGFYRNLASEMACILGGIPELHPHMKVMVDSYKKGLGLIYDDHLLPLVEYIEKTFNDPKVMVKILSNKLDDVPLNDVGEIRTITFKVLGVEWKIRFQNTAVLNAIAEEFCSLLQITLCEIGLLGTDLHLLQMPVTINISEAQDYTNFIEQKPSHQVSEWNLGIPTITKLEQAQMQYAFLAVNIKIILNNLSLLQPDEFDNEFDELYNKQKLGEKGMSVVPYQIVYLNMFKPQDFDDSQRAKFSPVVYESKFKEPSNLLETFDSLSGKYNSEISSDYINQRYNNIPKNISITLDKWIAIDEFKQIIYNFRKQGWLDWQILMAIRDYLLNMKANMNVNALLSDNEEENERLFREEFWRLHDLPEEDCYVEFPLSILKSQRFIFHLEQMPIDTLGSFGLYNNMKHPNFTVVHLLMNKRFKFNIDDLPENSPLIDL